MRAAKQQLLPSFIQEPVVVLEGRRDIVGPIDHPSAQGTPRRLEERALTMTVRTLVMLAAQLAGHDDRSSCSARGILSQTLSNEDGIELVLFTFAPGEQLSEHMSARPAIIHILSGGADLTVGVDAYRATPGTWVRMPADTRHSVVANTALVMALYLLPRAVAATS